MKYSNGDVGTKLAILEQKPILMMHYAVANGVNKLKSEKCNQVITHYQIIRPSFQISYTFFTMVKPENGGELAHELEEKRIRLD
jgi:hypothetical protein